MWGTVVQMRSDSLHLQSGLGRDNDVVDLFSEVDDINVMFLESSFV